MAKTGGKKTKERILRIAEDLFAENGFDGTDVDEIVKTAGVNKALIYYHFKDKNDIILSLYKNMIEQAAEYIECLSETVEPESKDSAYRKMVKEEMDFLNNRKKIVTLMLMESLKGSDKDNQLLKFGEMIINHRLNRPDKCGKKKNDSEEDEKKRYFVYDFFTGIIPLILFVSFEDKWCEYFKCDKNQLQENFIDSFINSHIKGHFIPGIKEKTKEQEE